MLDFIKYTLNVVLEATDKIRHYKYYKLLEKEKAEREYYLDNISL